MKKLIVLLVLAVLLGSPWFVGLRARSVVEGYVQQLDATPGYTATVSRYDQGYFSSDAVINVGYDLSGFIGGMPPEQQAEMQGMLDAMRSGTPLQLDIRHGPVLRDSARMFGLFSAELELSEGSEALQVFEALYGVDAQFTTQASFGFDGEGEIVFAALPFSVTTPDGRFDFGGIDYRVDLQDWGKRFDSTGEIHASRGSAAGMGIDFAPVVLTAEGDLSEGFVLWTGTATFETEGLTISGPMGAALEGLSMTVTTTNPTPETLNATYRFALRRLGGGMMGETLENVVIHGSALNMNKEALRETYAAVGDPALVADPQYLMNLLERLYGGDAELRLDEVSFRYGSDVDLHLTGAYSFAPGFFSSLANAAVVPPNPLQMLGAMEMQMSLDFSRGVLDSVLDLVLRNQVQEMAPQATPEQVNQLIEMQKLQMTMMVPQLVQSGMLREQGRGYQADLQLQGGTLTVNGNPIPIPGV